MESYLINYSSGKIIGRITAFCKHKVRELERVPYIIALISKFVTGCVVVDVEGVRDRKVDFQFFGCFTARVWITRELSKAGRYSAAWTIDLP
jgi:hypothetical protein